MEAKAKLPPGTVTLKDVARRVGVNPTTVAVVLNGTASGTRVSEKTREAILAAGRELGYQPNHLAQSLRRGRSGLIGLYSGYGYLDVRNPFLAETVSGVTEGCAELGLDIVLHASGRRRTAEELYEAVHGGRIDGLLLLAPSGDHLGKLMDESRLPAVAIGDPVAGLPSVLSDDETGGRLVGEKALELGHRRILYRGPSSHLESVTRRRKGFGEAFVKGGGEIVSFDRPNRSDLPHPQREFLSEEEWASLKGPQPCTAIVCWEDQCAHATVDQLRSNGFLVPESCGVIGYDGCVFDVPFRVDLTTVHANWYAVGMTSVRVLLRRIAGEDVPESTVLPVKFLPGTTM